MEKNLSLTLRDVYGGDGNVRYIEVQEETLARVKSSSRTQSDLGIAAETAVNEVKTQLVRKEVGTFRYENEKPVLRLGGAHGKLWGTMKSIRITLNMLGVAGFKSARLMDMIQILPVWVELSPLAEMQLQQLPQIMNNVSRSMIIQYFDVIPKATCQVKLVYPDSIEPQVTTLVVQLKFASFLNKRRATCENIEILQNDLSMFAAVANAKQD